MSLATRLTVKEIQQGIVSCGIWNFRQNIFIPNVSWGLLPYEADMLIMDKSGYVTEIEIKRSWEDLMADFKKEHSHDAVQVYRLYFCIPEGLVERFCEWYEKYYIDGGTMNFGLLSYNELGEVKKRGGCGYAEQMSRRKLFIEERLQLARLGCMRLWNSKK